MSFFLVGSLIFGGLAICLTPTQASAGNPGPADRVAPFPGEKQDFRGYDRYGLDTDFGEVTVLCPTEPAAGRPWVWRGSFWGSRRNPAVELTVLADLQLLEKGYHVVVAGPAIELGHPSGNAAMDAFYGLMTRTYGLSSRPTLMGLSRECLAVYRWASANPEKVASIYIDNGVCVLQSWPGGRGVPGSTMTGSGNAGQWNLAKELYGFASDAEALAYRENPADLLEPLARADVPILHVSGLADEAVPYAENSAVMKERYTALGGRFEEVLKEEAGHHPHGLEDPAPIIEFILRHHATE